MELREMLISGRIDLLRLLVFSLILGLLVNVCAVIPSVYSQPSVLTLKWEAYGTPGGGESLLIADVRADYDGMEIFYAGIGSGNVSEVVCLNAENGSLIWNSSVPGVGDTVQIQMGDVDNDGNLEIVAPMIHPAGLYVLHAENGEIMWSKGPIPAWGRVDCSPVIADIDGDGYPTIFFATMAFTEQPNTGKLIAFEYDPVESTIVERYRRIIWHPCSGGLSIADTDNDGVHELYMGDRNPYNNDGGWGKGCRSFWAENLSSRWDLYDWHTSSNIPMIADVNKDGVLDIVTGQLYGGVAVLNSSDGRPLDGRISQTSPSPVHYQPSICDIDGDGNLEILVADGEHMLTSQDVVIWDLYNWEEDGRLRYADYGMQSFFGPQTGEVTGDGLLDIVVASYTGIHIFDGEFNLVDEVTGLVGRLTYAVMQDIDDDGLNEIVVASQGRRIYAFDTLGIAANPRARTEVQFYSEQRLGSSVHVPFERPWPDVSSPSPVNGQKGVSTSLSELSFTLSHPDSVLMNYTVTTDPDVGSNTAGPVGEGRQHVTISGLSPSTSYTWYVDVSDGDHWTHKTFTFSTGPYTPNRLPTHNTPLLVSNGSDNDDLTCFNLSTTDLDGDMVTNIYNWYRNSESITRLLLPFDTETSDDDEYSGLAVAKDYSGYSNDGQVFGAAWTNDSVVGGAYTFDGNDFIRIEENDATLGGDGTWNEITIEFWVKATTSTWTERLITKHDRYNMSMSYRVDFRARSSRNDITWRVYTPSEESVSYSIYGGAREWHHIICTYKSGDGVKIYVDGEEAASSSASGNIRATSSGVLHIGYDSGSDFIGVLDEVKIYKMSLSPSQVSNHYEETKDGLTSNSTIVWQETSIWETWQCQVTPNDGYRDGESKFSNTLQITNNLSDPEPPTIYILSPENITYSENVVFLNFIANEPTSWTGYSLDGQQNITLTGDTVLTDLSDATHTLTVFANDTAGNMGVSDTVYFTVNTFPPDIVMIYPENRTYLASSAPLTFTVNKPTSWIGYSLDGQANITITGNITLASLLDGPHMVAIYANDTAGRTGSSGTVYFSVNTVLPDIVMIYPENRTYAVNSVPLTFTVDQPTSWIGYSLDGQANVSTGGNTTLVGLSDGTHKLIVYANDTYDRMIASIPIDFTVDTTQPEITDVVQTPSKNDVSPEDVVKVNVTILDATTGVRMAVLNYSDDSGVWIQVEMTHLEFDVWNATIPSFPSSTNVTYVIMVKDDANNTISTEELGYEYTYKVIPEFPSAIVLVLFMITTVIAIIRIRKKSVDSRARDMSRT
jgi:hypothetical protein